MAAWVLACPDCKGEFQHAKIDDRTLLDYFHPIKPVFPHEGLAVVCPSCTHETVFNRHQLVYRA
jgi:uncharacterized protein YbaR (Trm112 family)